MAESEDRTQGATERRRAQAREQGQAPLSREVVNAAVLAAATLVLSMSAPSASKTLAIRLQAFLTHPDLAPGDALREAAMAFGMALLPFAGAALAAGTLAVMLQTGWLIHGGALVPSLERLDPRRGLKRIFGLSNAAEAAKALAKLGVLAWAVQHTVGALTGEVSATVSWSTGMLVDRLAREILRVFILVLACQCGIALLDAGWVRFRFERQLRMSLEEIKQEQKETDGDPRLKAKIRAIRLGRARRRMLQAVKTATVVITNPTHYAVALAYERGAQSAPRIVAKGVDDMAARIREAAQEHGVAIVPNPPLARALHQLPLDAEVPPEHFKAVAEIIAYVWRLRTPGARAGGRP